MRTASISGSRAGLGRLILATALALVALMATASSAWAIQAVAPDGSVFVAWEAVQVTRIAPDGVPSGVITDIAPEPQVPPSREQTENSHVTGIAVAPSGVVTVVWLDIVSWSARIMTRRLAADGTPLGEPVELAAGQEIHIRPQLGLAPDGTATVAWGRPTSSGGEIAMRRIAPDGTPGAVQTITSDGDPYRLHMATAPDGTATVVWNRKEEDGTLLMERRVAPDGTLEPETHQLGASDWAMGEPQVALAADGTARVLWERWGHTDDEEIWTRQVEPDGSPEPEGHLLDAAEGIGLADLEVAPDGTALATWSANPGGRRAAFIAADGTPATAGPITVAGSPLAEWPSIVATPDSGFMLSWHGQCGPKQCVQVGEIEEDREVAVPITLDEGGRVGRGEGIFLPDGTGSYVWSQGFLANGDGALRTRRVGPDGTLGPIHDLYQPAPQPLVNLFPGPLDFATVTVGSSSSRVVGVFVASVEPLGTFSTSIAGPDADQFEIGGTTCSAADAHPTNCTVTVSFTPEASGPAAAELVVTAGAGSLPATVALSGEGVARAPEPSPPPAQPPVAEPQLQLGKPRVDSAAGSAILPVEVPGPGTVRFYGPCVGGPEEARLMQVDAAGSVELAIVAKGHCRRQLLRKGATRFGVRVVFSGADGQDTVQHRPVALRLER